MIQQVQPRTQKGTCEICEKEGVVVYTSKGNITACAECLAVERAAIAENKQIVENVVETSRKIDSTIELSQDIWNAATTSFISLQAAISHDDSITQENKDYALVKEANDRIRLMSEAIFAKKAEITQLENERHAWISNAQNMVPKLRIELREQFSNLDVSYKPITPKTIKPKKDKVVKTGKVSSFNAQARNELKDACDKYDVPAGHVRSMVISRPGMSYDAAARELAVALGKTLPN